MAGAKAYFVPTLAVYDLLLARGSEWGLDDASMAKLEMVGRQGRHALELAHRAGVRIAPGPTSSARRRQLKGRELAIKAEVLGPMGAIVSATRTNAELLGVSDRLGTMEPGKIADLIVTAENPLEHIGLFEDGRKNVILVVKDGDIYKM